jgi:hypothetical protein
MAWHLCKGRIRIGALQTFVVIGAEEFVSVLF